jgi:nitrate reductase beta subunit
VICTPTICILRRGSLQSVREDCRKRSRSRRYLCMTLRPLLGIAVYSLTATVRVVLIPINPTVADRFVIPTVHRELGEDAYDLRGSCGFSFGNGCSDGRSEMSLFGAPKKKAKTPMEVA